MECKIKDLSLYYEEVGNGRPIIMLHGRPLDHHHMLSDFEPMFAKRSNWRRIYPDMPGMGKTKAADWIVNQDQMLDILIEFIDTVIPGQRFVVAGTSYGGYLARGLIHQKGAQIDGVLLNVPYMSGDKQKLNLPAHQIRRQDNAFIEALQPDEQDLKDMVVSQSLDLLKNYRETIAPAQAIANHEFIANLRKNFMFSFEPDCLTPPFPAPTLILTGRFDHWCGYREAYQLLDSYSRATFAVLDCAGHSLPSEQQVLFQALVNEWLDRVEEYTR